MEQEILEGLHERIVKTFMDILILTELNDDNAISGYDVIAFIHNNFHMRISSGTVYSAIYSLERNGLIEGYWNKRKRTYKLTTKGKETIKTVLNASEKIQKLMARLEPKPQNVKRNQLTSFFLNHFSTYSSRTVENTLL